MKQVKLLLRAFMLFVAMGIQQNVVAQDSGSSQSSSDIVGKWISEKGSIVIINKDGAGFAHYKRGNIDNIEGTNIYFAVDSEEYDIKWKLGEHNSLDMYRYNYKIILGDNSFYPANIMKQIQNYIEKKEQSFKGWSYSAYLTLDETLEVRDGAPTYWLRDKSGTTPQELNHYKKDVPDWEKDEAGWNKKAKEKQDLTMAKLKKRALSSGNESDYMLIADIYETGRMRRILNDFAWVTICLDSALVWYKKAATIDPKNEKHVERLKYKMKTGRDDYYQHKEEEENKAAYNSLCKKYGKKYVDDASHGRITIGMPEALLFGFFKTKLVQETASSKLYRIYGWGATDFGTTVSISNTALLKSVWVSNGKVSSVRNWQ